MKIRGGLARDRGRDREEEGREKRKKKKKFPKRNCHAGRRWRRNQEKGVKKKGVGQAGERKGKREKKTNKTKQGGARKKNPSD